MKAVLHVNNGGHQRTHVEWMREGLGRHGIETEAVGYDQPKTADFAVVWNWRQNRVKENCIREGMPILVMEAGHLQDRLEFTSLGWGGLGRHARYPDVDDGGARFRRYWDGFIKPWKDGGNYVLLCGQCDGDASLHGVNFRMWTQSITDTLRERGERVVYRPHPLMVRRHMYFCPAGAELSVTSLESDLAGARFAVVYNSTVGVECVLAGVPTVTRDQGSMAWPVSSHSLDEPLWRGARKGWAHRLAWCQWNEQELRSGEAWEAVREVMNA